MGWGLSLGRILLMEQGSSLANHNLTFSFLESWRALFGRLRRLYCSVYIYGWGGRV